MPVLVVVLKIKMSNVLKALSIVPGRDTTSK